MNEDIIEAEPSVAPPDLGLRIWPNPGLSVVCKAVNLSTVNIPDLKDLCGMMLDTMYDEKGIGLAAPQVGVDARIIVVDVSPAGNDPRMMINPEIIESRGEMQSHEGCLSFPGVMIQKKRFIEVKIKYLDLELGSEIEMTCKGLLGACIQHEIDHLNGVTIIDGISQLKRERAIKKLKKETKK
jgi:peptide deformylase